MVPIRVSVRRAISLLALVGLAAAVFSATPSLGAASVTLKKVRAIATKKVKRLAPGIAGNVFDTRIGPALAGFQPNPSEQWVSTWSHSDGAVRDAVTTGWILNPADPAQGGSSANVTVTLYINDCGSPDPWLESQLVIPPGGVDSFFSFPAPMGQTTGSGCLHIVSDQPVVPLNGEIHVSDFEVSSGERAEARTGLDFWPVAWGT